MLSSKFWQKYYAFVKILSEAMHGNYYYLFFDPNAYASHYQKSKTLISLSFFYLNIFKNVGILARLKFQIFGRGTLKHPSIRCWFRGNVKSFMLHFHWGRNWLMLALTLALGSSPLHRIVNNYWILVFFMLKIRDLLHVLCL